AAPRATASAARRACSAAACSPPAPSSASRCWCRWRSSGCADEVPMRWRTAAVGLLLGFSLSWVGFADFGEVHKMFTLRDLRLLFTFFAGVALTAVGLMVCVRGQRLVPRPIHKGTLIGGALFGLGWAVTGACPGAALVMVGEGQLAALVT